MNGWSKEDLEEMCGDDIVEQLAFLSGCHQHELCNGNPSGWIIPDESLRKFAELIVRECMSLAQSHPSQIEDFAAGIDSVRENIKEHFGIKE